MQSKKIAHVVFWLMVLGVLGGAIALSRRADLAQTGKRDLSSPSSRLVGHWQRFTPSRTKESEMFFGPIGADGKGELYEVDRSGVIFHHRYEVVQEKKLGRRMRIRHFLSETNSRTEDVEVSLNGQTARHTQVQFDRLLTRSMSYLGDAVEPQYDEVVEDDNELLISR